MTREEVVAWVLFAVVMAGAQAVEWWADRRERRARAAWRSAHLARAIAAAQPPPRR